LSSAGGKRNDKKAPASINYRAAGLAHDMGNLLQIIASALRQIERSVGEDQLKQMQPFLVAATQSVERAGILKCRLVEQARSPHARRIMASEVLRTIRGLIALSAGPTISVGVAFDPDTPAISCNAHEFENAVLNLVANARDAMPDGGRLWISTHSEQGVLRNRTASASTAVICIRDEGLGIPQARLKKIFKPYFSTKQAGRHAGLGLAMVNEFARDAGGSVEMQSVIGEGTTVFLRLPSFDE